MPLPLTNDTNHRAHRRNGLSPARLCTKSPGARLYKPQRVQKHGSLRLARAFKVKSEHLLRKARSGTPKVHVKDSKGTLKGRQRYTQITRKNTKGRLKTPKVQPLQTIFFRPATRHPAPAPRSLPCFNQSPGWRDRSAGVLAREFGRRLAAHFKGNPSFQPINPTLVATRTPIPPNVYWPFPAGSTFVAGCVAGWTPISTNVYAVCCMLRVDWGGAP